MTPDVSVIIPFRGTDPHRQANLTCVLDHLAETGLPLILASDGRPDGALFNRSAAFNHGRELSPSHTYVWHEADMIVDLQQLDDGIAVAQNRIGLVVPFTRYRYFGQEASRLILSGVKPETLFPDRIMDEGSAVGAVTICSEESMQAVGQWDTVFEGHGWDDRAMFHAFRVACGPATFIEGDASHLWHHMAYAPWERTSEAADAANYTEQEVQATVRNRARLRSYRAASRPEHIRALTSGES